MTSDNQGEGTADLRAIDLPSLIKNPLVSVLISNYNYGAFVGESIQSVLSQTYENFELIICDDGSTDNSVNVIRTFLDDHRVRLIQKENGGQPSALNVAFAQSRGEIICLLDSDDAFTPGKIERTVAAFYRSPECGICIHPIQPVDSDNKPIGPPYPRFLESGWVGPKALATGARCYGVPPTVGISFRKKVADIIFPIPLEYISPDAYLIRAGIFSSRVTSLPEPLGLFRVHGDNITGLYYPTIKSARRVITDAQMYVRSMRDFLAARYGQSLADRLRIEDNYNYWNNLLAYYVLTSELGFGAKVSRPVELVQHLPWGRNKVIWWFLVKLPRLIARPLFRFWWGQSPLRNLTRQLIYYSRKWKDV